MYFVLALLLERVLFVACESDSHSFCMIWSWVIFDCCQISLLLFPHVPGRMCNSHTLTRWWSSSFHCVRICNKKKENTDLESFVFFQILYQKWPNWFGLISSVFDLTLLSFCTWVHVTSTHLKRSSCVKTVNKAWLYVFHIFLAWHKNIVGNSHFSWTYRLGKEICEHRVHSFEVSLSSYQFLDHTCLNPLGAECGEG
jgi:hypothetical protein